MIERIAPDPMAAAVEPARHIVIRPSGDADVIAMLAIYRHHVARGVGDLGDYEPEALDEEDLKRRRKTMRRKRLPHLVAELDGSVVSDPSAAPPTEPDGTKPPAPRATTVNRTQESVPQ